MVVFLLCLAVFDRFVGVSNDAVNFLNSAIGAKVAKFRTVLIVASAGVAIGAVMSSGMMDVARHGIMQPANFSFYDVMNARYLSQLALVTDMVDASNLKLNAELSEVDARINIVYAYYRMKYVAGEI